MKSCREIRNTETAIKEFFRHEAFVLKSIEEGRDQDYWLTMPPWIVLKIAELLREKAGVV